MRGIIKPLPETVKSSVRSGVVVFDLTRIVEELIFNSLDAGATQVSVAVGVGTGYIKVADNGSGITRDGLALVGERYATSKFKQLSDLDTVIGSFGFRGEALGSISDVSLLEIVTKVHGRPNGYRKVIKGCKSLYLGIDDARKDVGTTVIVRDLFYNQPVRRKQLQSSPRKVLHSLKECVLKFALVHLEVSFKIIDIESEDELLWTHPSSSPMPLLTSSFGLEVSSSLHEFDVSDGVLKISGYVSGPCENFSGRVIQYVYINSRFISKGPIHRLLSQLAAKYSYSDLCNANDGSYSGKRCRVQTYSSYIFNLNCPRSLYDLTFEPSKTSVEFKDWVPILSFLEKAMTRIWNKYISYGHCLNHDEDMLDNDNMQKEGDNTVAAEEDVGVQNRIKRKKCRTQFCQNSIDFPAPQPKVLTEEFKYLSPCSSNKFSCLESSKTTLKFKECEVETGFACQTNYTARLHDGVFSPHRETIDLENGDHMEIFNGKDAFVEEYFLENNFTAERSIKCVESMIHTERTDRSNSDMSEILTSSGLSADCFEVGNYVEEIGDSPKEGKSLLHGCSSRRGLLSDRALHTSEEGFGFKLNTFGSKDKWLDHVDNVDIGDVDRADNSSQDFDVCHDKRESIWCSSRFTNQRDMFISPVVAARDALQLFSMEHVCLDEDIDLPPESADDFLKCGSSHPSFKYERSCVTPNPLVRSTSRELEPFIDGNACEKKFETDSYGNSADREKIVCSFGSGGTQVNFGRTHQFASSCMPDYASSKGDICNFHIDNLDYDLSPKLYDLNSDETKWFHLDCYRRGMTGAAPSHYRGMTGAAPSHCISFTTCVNEDINQRGQIRFPEKAYYKRPRSHSAPPFYRGKKKFTVSNSCCNMELGITQIATIHDTPILKGNFDVKHQEQASGLYHLPLKLPNVDDSSKDSRPDVGHVAGTNKVQNYEMQLGSQHLDNMMDSEDYSSRSHDSLASVMKWRTSCPLTSGGEKLESPDSKIADILDTSSGILDLAGDSLVPKSISKDCLKGAKVLQQVDRKYIPVVGGAVLAIIDQHAADERIRLEELRQKVLSGEMKTISYLNAEQELVLPELGIQLLHNYAEQIQSWGWICNFSTQNSRSFKKNLKLLHRQPSAATLLAVPCILGVNLTDVDLLEFLQQLADTDGSSAIPPSVLRVLNFKACRGAIMFGDSLLPSECSLIVEELKQTTLCFQCAHGRPTTVPLVNLELLHKQISVLGLESTGSKELWHGLRRHNINLERAAQRLNCARGQR